MAAKVKGGEKVVDVLLKSGADPDTAKEVSNLSYHTLGYLFTVCYFSCIVKFLQ